VIFVLLFSAFAEAQGPRGVTTHDAQTALAAQVAAQTYTIRRLRPQSKGVVVPGGGWVYAKGWAAGPGRVLTVAAVVADWPLGPKDQLEVIDHKGVPHTAAVGLLESALGLAVLDVGGLGSVPVPTPLLEEGALYGGRALFGAGDGGLLARFAVRGPGRDPFGFYWELDGNGLLGTPLVSMEGRLVSLIGVISPTEATRSLALPTKALKAVFERAPEWRP